MPSLAHRPAPPRGVSLAGLAAGLLLAIVLVIWALTQATSDGALGSDRVAYADDLGTEPAVTVTTSTDTTTTTRVGAQPVSASAIDTIPAPITLGTALVTPRVALTAPALAVTTRVATSLTAPDVAAVVVAPTTLAARLVMPEVALPVPVLLDPNRFQPSAGRTALLATQPSATTVRSGAPADRLVALVGQRSGAATVTLDRTALTACRATGCGTAIAPITPVPATGMRSNGSTVVALPVTGAGEPGLAGDNDGLNLLLVLALSGLALAGAVLVVLQHRRIADHDRHHRSS